MILASTRGFLLAFLLLSPLALGACSSALGGGSAPPTNPNVLVLPPGSTVVCTNGTPPPCQ